MAKIYFDLDNDENADWLKRVDNGRYRNQELEIHAQIAKDLANQDKLVKAKKLTEQSKKGETDV
jgi:hypothetical protein